MKAFSKKEYNDMLNGKEVWNSVYHRVINDKVFDRSNGKYVDAVIYDDRILNLDIPKYMLEDMNRTYTNREVYEFLNDRIGNLSLEPTYIDFGSNWVEDTIINSNGSMRYQTIAPMKIEKFRDGKFTIKDIVELGREIKKHNVKEDLEYSNRSKQDLANEYRDLLYINKDGSREKVVEQNDFDIVENIEK